MRIALTGATGFVGRAMARELAGRGHHLTCLVRSDPRPGQLPAEGVTVARGDILSPDSLARAFEDCDAVVHLVGIIRESSRASFEAVHVLGTDNVLEAAAACGVRRIVHMSAAGTRPGAASRYHQSKWRAEEAARASGLEWTILRPSLIFGKGDGFTTMLIDLVRKAPVVPVIGSGRNLFQPIAVEDVCNAFAACLEDAAAMAGNTFELGGPERLSFETILRVIAGRMKSRKPFVHVPAALMRLLSGTMSSVTSRFPLTPDQLIMLGEDNIAEPNHAVEALHLPLTPFAEGLDRILAP